MTVEQKDLVGVLGAVASGDADRREAVEELRARGVDTLDVLIEFAANEARSSASLEATRESRSAIATRSSTTRPHASVSPTSPVTSAWTRG